MKHQFYSKITWRFRDADYKGNSWFFAELCEKLDKQCVEGVFIESKRDGNHIEVVARVSAFAKSNETSELYDTMDNKLIAAGLPSETAFCCGLTLEDVK